MFSLGRYNSIKIFISLPGTLVPKATKVMAVTESFSLMVQPNELAKSVIIPVRIPIHIIDITKHHHPPP